MTLAFPARATLELSRQPRALPRLRASGSCRAFAPGGPAAHHRPGRRAPQNPAGAAVAARRCGRYEGAARRRPHRGRTRLQPLPRLAGDDFQPELLRQSPGADGAALSAPHLRPRACQPQHRHADHADLDRGRGPGGPRHAGDAAPDHAGADRRMAGRPAAGPGADCRGSGRAARRRGRGRAGLARCRHAAHLLRRQRLHGALRPALDADLPARHGARAPAARRHRLRRLGGAVRAGRVQRAGDPQALFALERGLGRIAAPFRDAAAQCRGDQRDGHAARRRPAVVARTRPAPSRRSWPPRCASLGDPGTCPLHPLLRPGDRHGHRRLAGDHARCQPGGDLRHLDPARALARPGRRGDRHLEGGDQHPARLCPAKEDHGLGAEASTGHAAAAAERPGAAGAGDLCRPRDGHAGHCAG